jgi:hypothetical protein
VAEILTKKESLDLAVRGCFGNILPLWRSIDEYKASGFKDYVMLRYNEPMSPFNRDGIAPEDFDAAVTDALARGAKYEKLTVVCGSDPNKGNYYARWMNGEIMRTHDTIYELYYALLPKADECMVMRESLQKYGERAYGLRAREIVRYYMSPSSFADLEAIWEQWPTAVVEFSIFKRNVGDRPHRETVFWEVRSGY